MKTFKQIREHLQERQMLAKLTKKPYPKGKDDADHAKRGAEVKKKMGGTASFLGRELEKIRQKKMNEEKTGADYMKQYPTSNHQHIVHNDDEHHIIKGVKHSEANADKAEEGVRKHAAKKMGVHHNDLEAYGHEHMHKDDAHHFEGKPHVHASMAAYIKHHGDHRAAEGG